MQKFAQRIIDGAELSSRSVRSNGNGHGNGSLRSDQHVAEHFGHFVQFYEDDGGLVDAVATFIGAGLGSAEGGIVIATAEHRDTIAKQLRARGFDLAAIESRGQYVALDAAEMLSRFMSKGLPDEALFKEVVGGLICEAGKGRRGLRAFGEMVALLYADKNSAAAIRLEDLWNELSKEQTFSLFCAYPLNGFGGAANGQDFERICQTHSSVLPSEKYFSRNEQDRLREIASLQQKALALECEIRVREQAEKALRDSGAQLQTELADSKLLQSISTEIVSESNMEALYQKLVDAASTIMRSDFASMQMYYPERSTGELRLLALRGFGPEAATTWQWVSRESPTSCGEALRRGKRVIATDVEQCEFLGADGLAAYRAAGIASMQSTPLFSRTSALVGMLSTHWRRPHRPGERELRVFDILARLATDVVERRRNEMALRESEERFRNIFNQSTAGIAQVDIEGRFLLVNQRFCEMTGYSAEELRGKTCGELTYVADQAEDHSAFKNALRKRQSYLIEKRYIRSDGALIWVRNHVSQMTDPDGAVRRMLAVSVDITEQKKAEALLSQSNALLECQKDAFQAAMRGSSLEESLTILLNRVVEATGRRARAAFYRVSSDGNALHHICGMHEHYARTVDGYPVSGESMACGLAVHTGEPVIARDVEEDPKWKSYRWLARQHNFRACWSFPVRTTDGPILGTLAIYLADPSEPTGSEMNLATVVAHAATVVISRHQQTAERTRAEQSLRETNERLQKVLEIETVGVMFWDLPTGCLVDANKTFLEMMGYSREDVESRSLTWEKFTPPEYHDLSRAEIVKFQNTGRVGPYEKEYFHKDGSRRWLLFAGSSLGNNQCVEFCVDVSEQRKIEKALRQSEELYRATFENAAVGIAHVGLDGRWLRFNQAICSITGYAREELEHLTFTDITHPEDIERDWQHARELIVGHIPRYAIEKRYIRKDRSIVWVMLTVSLIRDAAGQPLHFVSVIENIDEKKRAHEILEQTVTERTASLREAVEQMEEFSYSVSHDLRGPLRAMNAYAGVLLEDYGSRLDETGRGYLEKIQRSSDRMNRLTRDVLAYSRVARSVTNTEKINLDLLVRDVLSQHANLQQPAAEIEVSGILPEVLGHETTLAQSVSNLLNNAVKFVAADVKPHVRVYAECLGKNVRVWFEDNGIGIKPEHQKRIFNMFERVHPDGQYEGTGIGLTIVRKAIEKMGGKVGVESDGQNGSRFYIGLRRSDRR